MSVRFLVCIQCMNGYLKVGKSFTDLYEAIEAAKNEGGMVIARKFFGHVRVTQKFWPELKEPIFEPLDPMTLMDQVHWDASDNGDEAEPYHLQ